MNIIIHKRCTVISAISLIAFVASLAGASSELGAKEPDALGQQLDLLRGGVPTCSQQHETPLGLARAKEAPQKFHQRNATEQEDEALLSVGEPVLMRRTNEIQGPLELQLGGSPGGSKLGHERWESSFVETQSWRYKYIDELDPGLKVQVLEETLDSRLANLVYTTHSVRLANIDMFTFNSGSPEFDEKVRRQIAGPEVDEAKCGKQLAQILAHIDHLKSRVQMKRRNATFNMQLSERDVKLAAYLDSFGRYESGHMIGKLISPGSQAECTNTELILEESKEEPSQQKTQTRVTNRFCWALLSVRGRMDRSLLARQVSPLESKLAPLMVGICLPKSCHTKSFERTSEQTLKNRELLQQLVSSQFKLPDSLYVDDSLPVDSVYCMVDDKSDYGIPLFGKVLLASIVCWCLLACYATWKINWKEEKVPSGDRPPALKERANPVLECLDLRRGWEEFLCENDDSGRFDKHVDLDVLNFIKAFGCAYVVFGHSFIANLGVAMNGLQTYNTSEKDPLMMAVVVGTLIVDTFFVITGILFGYLTCSKMFAAERSRAVAEKQQDLREAGVQHQPRNMVKHFLSQWAGFSLKRYFRLLPLMAIVFFFKKAVFMHWQVGNPLWDNGFNKETMAGACRQETWLSPFLFLSAYLPLARQCVPQAWSVSTDVFFSFLVPPILFSLTKRPKLAISASFALSLISLTWAYLAIQGVHPSMLESLLELRFHGFALVFGNLSHFYTYPHFRICSVMVGIVGGYILANYKKQQEEQAGKEWPRWFSGPATNLAIITQIMIFVSVSFLPVCKALITPYHRQVLPIFLTYGRLLWGITNIIVYIRMTTDWKDTFLMKFSGGKLWKILIKLNLAILLIHVDVLYMLISTETSLHFTKMAFFKLFSAAYITCLPIALFLHIVLENPIDKLTRRFLLQKILPSSS